jgi:hypothetical protein
MSEHAEGTPVAFGESLAVEEGPSVGYDRAADLALAAVFFASIVGFYALVTVMVYMVAT